MKGLDSSIKSILISLADIQGIVVEPWDYVPPINGLYWNPKERNIPPFIGLDRGLIGKELNHVLAHELGHHQLHQGEGNLLHCQDRGKVMKAERQADAFASKLINGIRLALIEGTKRNVKPYEILISLAETAGVNIRRVKLLDPLNGLYWEPGIKPPVIFLDETLRGAKLNHVLAHELGHHSLLHMDEGDLLFCKDIGRVEKSEKQADAFATMLIDGIKLALAEGRKQRERYAKAN